MSSSIGGTAKLKHLLEKKVEALKKQKHIFHIATLNCASELRVLQDNNKLKALLARKPAVFWGFDGELLDEDDERVVVHYIKSNPKLHQTMGPLWQQMKGMDYVSLPNIQSPQDLKETLKRIERKIRHFRGSKSGGFGFDIVSREGYHKTIEKERLEILEIQAAKESFKKVEEEYKFVDLNKEEDLFETDYDTSDKNKTNDDGNDEENNENLNSNDNASKRSGHSRISTARSKRSRRGGIKVVREIPDTAYHIHLYHSPYSDEQKKLVDNKVDVDARQTPAEAFRLYKDKGAFIFRRAKALLRLSRRDFCNEVLNERIDPWVMERLPRRNRFSPFDEQLAEVRTRITELIQYHKHLTGLRQAAHCGDMNRVSRLLEETKKDIINKIGRFPPKGHEQGEWDVRTAADLAIENGFIEVGRFLLDKGALISDANARRVGVRPNRMELKHPMPGHPPRLLPLNLRGGERGLGDSLHAKLFAFAISRAEGTKLGADARAEEGAVPGSGNSHMSSFASLPSIDSARASEPGSARFGSSLATSSTSSFAQLPEIGSGRLELRLSSSMNADQAEGNGMLLDHASMSDGGNSAPRWGGGSVRRTVRFPSEEGETPNGKMFTPGGEEVGSEGARDRGGPSEGFRARSDEEADMLGRDNRGSVAVSQDGMQQDYAYFSSPFQTHNKEASTLHVPKNLSPKKERRRSVFEKHMEAEMNLRGPLLEAGREHNKSNSGQNRGSNKGSYQALAFHYPGQLRKLKPGEPGDRISELNRK